MSAFGVGEQAEEQLGFLAAVIGVLISKNHGTEVVVTDEELAATREHSIAMKHFEGGATIYFVKTSDLTQQGTPN